MIPPLLDLGEELEHHLAWLIARKAGETRMWVCTRGGMHPCGQVFHHQPGICPRCGHDHGKNERHSNGKEPF